MKFTDSTKINKNLNIFGTISIFFKYKKLTFTKNHFLAEESLYEIAIKKEVIWFNYSYSLINCATHFQAKFSIILHYPLRKKPFIPMYCTCGSNKDFSLKVNLGQKTILKPLLNKMNIKVKINAWNWVHFEKKQSLIFTKDSHIMMSSTI